MIIGMMVENISDPFFAGIARGIEDCLYSMGYNILCCSTGNKPEKAKALIEILENQQVDAYIIAPAPGMEEDIDRSIGLFVGEDVNGNISTIF